MPARARARFRLSQDSFRRVTNSPPVRAKLLEVARRIAATATAIADAENVDTQVDVEIDVSDGTRPQGRGYARVTSSNADAEHGTAATPRRRVLGRATGLPYNP